jgi:hypothetical protein
MIHAVFKRRDGELAVYGADGRLWSAIAASGDARGDGLHPPYGSGYPIAPGHYRLVGQTPLDPPTPEDGSGIIYVDDLDTAALQILVNAGRAKPRGADVEIAGISLPVGGLARYGRSAIAIHGGGAALSRLAPAEDPLAPFQRLTRGDGGTRVHNADLVRLMALLAPVYASNTIVFSAIGDPPRLQL